MNRKLSELKNKAMYFNGLQVNFTGSNPVSLTIISSFGKHNKINYLACKPLKLKGYFIGAFPFCTKFVLSTSQIIRSKIALFQTKIVVNRRNFFSQTFLFLIWITGCCKKSSFLFLIWITGCYKKSSFFTCITMR